MFCNVFNQFSFIHKDPFKLGKDVEIVFIGGSKKQPQLPHPIKANVLFCVNTLSNV